MVWVFVFAGLVLVSLVVFVGWGRWLIHKVSDVLAEVNVVTGRLDQIGELLAEIRVPDPAASRLAGPRGTPPATPGDLLGETLGDDNSTYDERRVTTVRAGNEAP